jgi:hypothetical protein
VQGEDLASVVAGLRLEAQRAYDLLEGGSGATGPRGSPASRRATWDSVCAR